MSFNDLYTVNEKEMTMTFNLVSLLPIFGSLLRHGLTAAGGFLVAKGLAQPEAVESAASGLSEIVMGSAVYGIGQLLSAMKSKENAKNKKIVEQLKK